MKFNDACIPLGGAWSSPFVRWQGSLAELNALDLAVDVTRRALARVGPARMPKAPVPAVRWKK